MTIDTWEMTALCILAKAPRDPALAACFRRYAMPKAGRAAKAIGREMMASRQSKTVAGRTARELIDRASASEALQQARNQRRARLCE